MDCQLADMERKCGIVRRWNQIDREYIEAERAFLLEKKTQILSCLWATVVKRQYLLHLKAKYAGTVHQYYGILDIIICIVL